jgi:G3E family GTPase
MQEPVGTSPGTSLNCSTAPPVLRVTREAGGSGEEGGAGAAPGIEHAHAHTHDEDSTCAQCEKGVHGGEEGAGVGGVHTIVLRTDRQVILERFNQFVADFLQEHGVKVLRVRAKEPYKEPYKEQKSPARALRSSKVLRHLA